MGIFDDMLPIVDDARTFLSDEGGRRYTVTVRTVRWDGGAVGVGNPTPSDLILQPNPKVQEVDDKTITIGHITPAWSTGTASGGYTLAQLRPLTGDPAAHEDPAVEFFYIVEGPNGTIRYALTDVVSSDGPALGEGAGSLRYKLVLQSLSREGPR
jgi:hypothetical protein